MSGFDPSQPEQLRAALRLYAITPTHWTSLRQAVEASLSAIVGGVTALQLRVKADTTLDRRELAVALRELTWAHGVLFIVNDDVPLARACRADGVHVGPADHPVAVARGMLEAAQIVGASAGDPDRARRVHDEGAAYLGVGAIYDARGSKADAISDRGTQVLRDVRACAPLAQIPVVAIGGIAAGSAAPCIEAGADGVAVIRALWDSPHEIEARAHALRTEVDEALAFRTAEVHV